MQILKSEVALVLPGDDGKVGWSHAGSHEEDHILMSGLSVVHHLLFKELQMVLIVPIDLKKSDGNLSVPPTLVDFTPAALDKQNPEAQYKPLLKL